MRVLLLIILTTLFIHLLLWNDGKTTSQHVENDSPKREPGNKKSVSLSEIGQVQRTSLDISFLFDYFGFQEEAIPQPTPQQLSNKYIHPSCLESSAGNNGYAHKCNEKDFTDVEITFNAGKTTLFKDHDADDRRSGYVSYTLHDQRYKNGFQFMLTSMTWSGGGTGIFSEIFVLGRMMNTDHFFALAHLKQGDRCNDGFTQELALTGSQLSWSTAATPFRLLNPEDNTNWRNRRLEEILLNNEDNKSASPVATFGDLQPYDDVANSALSCVGRLYKTMDLNTGAVDVTRVAIDIEGWQSQSQGDVALCLKNWGKQFFTGYSLNTVDLSLEEWQESLQSLAGLCT